MERHFVGGALVSLFLSASLLSATQASGRELESEKKAITIHVHNYAQVDSSVLFQSERIAAEILRKAGVGTQWLACSAGEALPGEAECAKPLSPLDLTLNLIATVKARQFRLANDAYGIAVEGTGKEFGCDAWVFYGLVKDAALQLQLSSAHILGSVIAHELGHLLLGANSHSRTGVMRGRWSREELLAADLDELSFSAPERDRIQRNVAARRQFALRN